MQCVKQFLYKSGQWYAPYAQFSINSSFENLFEKEQVPQKTPLLGKHNKIGAAIH